jgi:DNA sulfur modification protein DndD
MPQLEIQTLRMEDYRQYAGVNEIPLATNGTGTVNVIQGQNGAGKSNILNAITLCLYGKESHLEEAEANELETYPYLSRSKLDGMDNNEVAKGRIEVTLGDGEPQYIFTRELQTVKIGDNQFDSAHGDLKLKEKRGNDWKPVENVNTRLNQILPVHVHQYFLFDGERLDEFFAEGYQERVKAGLLDVSHIELLESGITHLENFESEVEGRLTNSGIEVDRKETEYREAQEELEDLEDELSQINTDIEEANSQITEINNKLRDSSIDAVREKQRRRDDLQDQLKNIRGDIATLRKETAENILSAGPAVYAQKSLDNTLGVLDELSEAGRLPPKIQETFVQELLDSGQCICGEELDDEHRVHLQSLEREMSKVDESNLEGQFAIPNVKKEARKDVRGIKSQRQKLANLEEKQSEKDATLNDISEELKAYDIPEEIDVKQLEEERERLEKLDDKLREEKGKLKVRISEQESTVEKRKKEWKDLISDEKKNQQILNQLEFLEDSRKEIQSVKADILGAVRAEMNEKMDRYFNEIIWKDESYDIELTDEYSVRVLDSRGGNKIGSLSAGEGQVLAFSFLAALTSVSGFSAPLVIDTPLGRISSTPKARLAQNLPEYIDESQMTFLMTDEEYTDQVRMNMTPNVSNEFRLNFSDEVTKVVPYE